MPDLTFRSYEAELLDQPDIERTALFQNLKELDSVNRLLGGHAVTINGIKQLVTEKNKTYTVVDFGCGSGDTLRVLSKWSRRNGIKLELANLDVVTQPYREKIFLPGWIGRLIIILLLLFV